MAKPNYSFEKRQRELAKKKKQDEKEARKREAREAARTEDPAPGSDAPDASSGPPALPEAPAPRRFLKRAAAADSQGKPE